ncbi:unnamed protein product [Menidia menidia]|uniref:Outer dense fiber protein 2 n=1 Tax=Menidia menidia TaxID=238744 RepID=A0A8S4B291_9TELE|nr:unnamed protein product [Menidia menidia]
MKTRDSTPPPPIHVHVPETTPVHVHMRRSPSRTQAKHAQVKEDRGRSKAQTPWIPPGRLSCRRDLGSYRSQQPSRTQYQSDPRGRRQQGSVEQELFRTLQREQENTRHSKKSDSQSWDKDTDVLLRALVEAQIDGVAVTNQLTSLKETVDTLTKEKRLPRLHATSLERQYDQLLEKIEMFDHSNHSLRDLLRKWGDTEREASEWSGEKDALKKRLADAEVANMRLLAELTNKEKGAYKLSEHVDLEKENAKTGEDLSRLLESTCSHLESQLHHAEIEKAQLTEQIQSMQQSHERKQVELHALQEELHTLRQQRDDSEVKKDQELLALLTKQTERAEESARELAEKLQEKESQLSQSLSASSHWRLRHSREASAKGQLEQEISTLRIKVAELSCQLQSVEEKTRDEREELRDQLHQLSVENTSTKLENQSLKSQLSSTEEKIRGYHSETRQLKSSIKKYESLVEKYKNKVQLARLESEEHRLKLEAGQKEVQEVQVSLEREKEQIRRELLGQLRELDTLPDKLRRAEQQLREAQQEADGHEQSSMEYSAALSDVRHKVEQQGAQLEMFQQRNLLMHEENKVFKDKIHLLERKVEEMNAENKEMSQALASREGSVRSLQHQLEEKQHECSVLSRRLQDTLDDAQKQVDERLQRVLVKERASQSKALDLQSQLSRAKTELSLLQRNKEEMEQRFQSQLRNMKERLEQSDSTNRSLQNYVHFLKTSYGNVFGDSLLSS